MRVATTIVVAAILGAVLFATLSEAKGMEAYYKRVGKKFLEGKGAEEGVHKLKSGMYFKILTKGSGDKSPNANDDCDVHYAGTLTSGKKFDSSYDRGQPASFKPTQVIKGWTEALQLMKEGDKWEVYIPYNLAYGASGRPPTIPAYATLVFTMELIKVKGKGKAGADATKQLEADLGRGYDEL